MSPFPKSDAALQQLVLEARLILRALVRRIFIMVRKTGKVQAARGKKGAKASKKSKTTKAKSVSAARGVKRVYFFGNGKAEGGVAMKDLLGGKGANLADMTLAGLPVPPGFTITTQTCKDYNDLGQKLPAGTMQEVRANLARTEKRPANVLAIRGTHSSSRSARARKSRCPA
jgi:hypothetical protein